MPTELIETETCEVVAGRPPVTVLPDTSGKRDHGAFAVDDAKLDTVMVNYKGSRQEMVLPATPYTCYWAFLRYMYQNHSRRVSHDEIVRGVERLMLDASPSRWEKFVNKKQVGAAGKKGQLVRRQPMPWKFRLITNMRNLCRIGGGPNSYGRRLLDRGKVIRYETDGVGNGYFILHMELTAENTVAKRRGRKKQDDSLLEALPKDIRQMIADGVIEKAAGFALLSISPEEQRAIIQEAKAELELAKPFDSLS